MRKKSNHKKHYVRRTPHGRKSHAPGIAMKIARTLCISIFAAMMFGFVVFFFLPNVFYSLYYKVAGTYRPGADELYDGIDISHHNGKIVWETVAKDPNIKFVYIKATEGYRHTDKQFVYNTTHARKFGLKVGAYHLLTTKTCMRTQFRYFASVADQYPQDLVPVVDVEENKVTQWTAQQKRDSIAKFMELAKEHYGVAPVLYCSHKFYKNYLSPKFDDQILFIARYSHKQPKLDGKRHNIWQFTEHGRIDGISGDVDLDRFGPNTSLSDILL